MTYGCHNRKDYVPVIRMQDGRYPDWSPILRWVPFNNSEHCNYTLSNLGQIDKGCEGCSRKMPAPQHEEQNVKTS